MSNLHVGSDAGEPPHKKKGRARREGPCVNGHQMTSGDWWRVDPLDPKRVLCKFCYNKLLLDRKRKACTGCGKSAVLYSKYWIANKTGPKGYVCLDCFGDYRPTICSVIFQRARTLHLLPQIMSTFLATHSTNHFTLESAVDQFTNEGGCRGAVGQQQRYAFSSRGDIVTDLRQYSIGQLYHNRPETSKGGLIDREMVGRVRYPYAVIE